MLDRVPTYPGRVQLVPVTGQPNVYDMTMADDPTEPGTALNKANLLKDATAALFGLTGAAVPDDVLAAIGAKWTQIETGTYTGTGTAGSGSGNRNELSFSFAPALVVVSGGGFTVVFVAGGTTAQSYTPSAIYGLGASWQNDGATLWWWDTDLPANAAKQLNTSGTTYYYTAIGYGG